MSLGSLAVFAGMSTAYFLPKFIDAYFNEETTEFAKLHDPLLPRNPAMDIYNKDNKITVNLTLGQVNTYYKVMRCLVKEKNFLPNHEKQTKHLNGLTKKELLIASSDPQNKEIMVSLQTTKAKARQMHRVLRLVDQLGVENAQDLKKTVEHDYRQYSTGKHHC